MTPTEAAQTMIDAVRSGARTLEYLAESLQIAEAHIAQGKAMAPFTCAEMAEVVALVRAALWPPDDTLAQTVANARTLQPAAETPAATPEDAPADAASGETAPTPQTLPWYLATGTPIPPLTAAEMDLDDWQAMDPEALEAEVHLHVPADTDVWTAILDHHHRGILTTRHAASSYGQPVVLVAGEVVDYARIAGLHLRGASIAAWERVHGALAPLGVRVTRQPGA